MGGPKIESLSVLITPGGGLHCKSLGFSISKILSRTWAKLKSQTIPSKDFFPKMISVILGSSHHADACSVSIFF